VIFRIEVFLFNQLLTVLSLITTIYSLGNAHDQDS